jgi:YegS/Rv2252/BmrU family lipid kinase
MKSSIVIINNPAARKSSFAKVRHASEILRAEGFQTEILFTERRGHAQELARDAVKKEPFLIIAAGGDGTINEAMNGMLYSPVPLAILPLGTTNVLALETGVPQDVPGAVQTALSRAARPISLGRIEFTEDEEPSVRHFCLMAGIGFDAKAVHDVHASIKKISGEASYILSGMRNFLDYHPKEIFFSVDGREYSGYTAIIGKSSRYGGNFKVTPDASLFDPYLYICIFRGKKRSDLLRYVFGILRGTHLTYPDVIYLKASSIEITGSAHMQVDGDYLGIAPATVTAAREAVKLIF